MHYRWKVCGEKGCFQNLSLICLQQLIKTSITVRDNVLKGSEILVDTKGKKG